MITFTGLKVLSSDRLIIDAEVKAGTYYNNVYIDKIIIDTQDTFVINGPSSSPIYSYQLPENSQEKSVSMALDMLDLNRGTHTDLFFVYVIAKGTPAQDTPCGMDNITTLGITYYDPIIVKDYLNYLKEVVNTCSIPKKFIDYFLKVKAFELAIESGNYIQAITFWNKFFKNKASTLTTNCDCHGIK